MRQVKATRQLDDMSESRPRASMRARERPKELWPDRLWVHIGLLLLTGMLLAATVAGLFWLALGRPKLTGGTLDTRGLIEALKLVLAVVGGTGAIVALTIAYRKQRHGEAAEYREDNKLFNERYAKGAELLGHERAAARMAGVYSIARLADDTEDFHKRQQCIDALCAYLRLPCVQGINGRNDISGEHTARDTTLRVIRDHLRPNASVSWDGHKFNFEGAAFHGGDLADTCISSGHITFYNATFASGEFYFTRMKILDQARIWFAHAKFTGGEVHFDSATFSGHKVSFDYAQFDGGRVDFANATNPKGVVSSKGATVGTAVVDWGPFSPPSPPS